MTPRCHGPMRLEDVDRAYGQAVWSCPCGRSTQTGPSDDEIYRREHPSLTTRRVRPVAAQLEGEWR